MKNYKEPIIDVNTFDECLATSLSGVMQTWKEQNTQRVTGIVDWSTAEKVNIEF